MTETAALTDDASPPKSGVLRVALLGNPNTGKTTLFNRLCGLRHKTSNFPGTTQESRVGFTRIGAHDVEVIDLPGVYSLELDQSESSVCRAVLAGQTAPKGETPEQPDVACVVVDASNLARNLAIVGEALRRRLATVVVINMQDVAARRGLRIDVDQLSEALGCEVVASQARSGEGIAAIREALTRARIPTDTPPGDEDGLVAWVDRVYEKAIARASDDAVRASFTDRLDRAFTHPIIGLVLFAVVMTGLFWVLFRLATVPMDLIDGVFGSLAAGIERVLPPGFLADMLANGVVAGVGATVIFLPQIVLLFLLISLLEDTGYLARAAFVMDRALRPFGLAGHSFVPLLSSHACALPGIMSARMIPDRRQRLATILVAPFMTCSARLPVYALLVTVLFPGRPGMQAVAFTGAYALGIVVALLSALLARRTILRGEGRPMALELPAYRMPSLKSAVLTTWDRSMVFLRKAGTVILAISIVLWWLGSYPIVDPPEEVESMRVQASALAATAPEDAAALDAEADAAEASHAVRESFMGRIGRTVQPVFEPLGYDWQLSVGVMASFAAREVFVSTMAVVVSGQDDAEDEGVLTALRTAQRSDGSPVFTTATAWSLLVYYVLAMQCLPTLAVTAREAGGWKWAGLQLAWMTGVAYVLAMVVTQTLRLLGVS
jgi:ferrous iron transport protein B